MAGYPRKSGSERGSRRKAIGAAVVESFLKRGYAVVATARQASEAPFEPSPNLVLVDGDIGKVATAKVVPETAIAEATAKIGTIDILVNNAGGFGGTKDSPAMRTAMKHAQATQLSRTSPTVIRSETRITGFVISRQMPGSPKGFSL